MPSFIETFINTYSGLSSETKPTVAGGYKIPNGSRWREVDTEKVFTFNLSDDTWYLSNPRIDSITHALETITYSHHEIHSGSHYYIENHTTLGSGDKLYVKLVTPNTTKWAHFLWEISSSFILETNLYEGSSGGMAGGGAATPINNNRNSANTSDMVITSGVAVATTLGTKISSIKWGSRSIGGGHSREDEILLKQNTTYLREFISGTNSNIISFKASWYEHTNKA